uniref:uncharacterized protein LOC122592003 n=1 Tax=Erigeron canadensis TaxID=72917 RepID=UPI001CB969DC|nr:uncharacterized protein LOC122592003 [Erigeron canadensis]
MFLRIARDINSFDSIEPLPKHFQFFHKGTINATGRPGFNIFQKYTYAIRQSAYSFEADALDEYLPMAQDTGYQCLDQFYNCVIHLYRDEYLRRPTKADIEQLTAKHVEIWHAYFGPACSNNDINVLNESDLFDDLLQVRDLRVEFSVNGRQSGKGYYLANGIYQEMSDSCEVVQVPNVPENLQVQ